jgi:hypothetical protein
MNVIKKSPVRSRGQPGCSFFTGADARRPRLAEPLAFFSDHPVNEHSPRRQTIADRLGTTTGNSLTANHLGQNATVCGVVALTNFDADAQFWPMFLDFGTPYPDQASRRLSTVPIVPRFGTPGTTLQGNGFASPTLIRQYRGKPEPSSNDPRQLNAIDDHRALAVGAR